MDSVYILMFNEFNYSLNHVSVVRDADSTNGYWAIFILEEIVKMTDEGLHLGPNHFCCDIVRPFLRFTIYSLITKPSFDF